MYQLPDEVFKRRRNHNNTPESILLILANYIVVFAASTLFADKKHINPFFWVVIAALAAYNFFTIRRNREEFQGAILISYIASTVILIGVFFLLKNNT